MHGWPGLPRALFVSFIILVSGCSGLKSHWHLATYHHTLPGPGPFSGVLGLHLTPYHVDSVLFAYPIAYGFRDFLALDDHTEVKKTTQFNCNLLTDWNFAI